MNKKVCGKEMEIYSRVVGYYRPVQNWNKGKKEEFTLRKTFKINESLEKAEEKAVYRNEKKSLLSV